MNNDKIKDMVKELARLLDMECIDRGPLVDIASGISTYQQEAAREELQERAKAINGRMQAIAVNEELLKNLSRNQALVAAKSIKSTGSEQKAQKEALERVLRLNRFHDEMAKVADVALINKMVKILSLRCGTETEEQETRLRAEVVLCLKDPNMRARMERDPERWYDWLVTND